MKDSKGELVQSGIYPKQFNIDYEGKTKEHMGVAILPFVNIDVIRKAYAKINSKSKKLARNAKGKTEIFKYDQSYVTKYTSQYGDILKNKVQKTYL